MIGPCLCGDPYCSSCGDPSLAEFEAMIDDLSDELRKLTSEECEVFIEAGRSAVRIANQYLNRIDLERNQLELDMFSDVPS